MYIHPASEQMARINKGNGPDSKGKSKSETKSGRNKKKIGIYFKVPTGT